MADRSWSVPPRAMMGGEPPQNRPSEYLVETDQERAERNERERIEANERYERKRLEERERADRERKAERERYEQEQRDAR